MFHYIILIIYSLFRLVTFVTADDLPHIYNGIHPISVNGRQFVDSVTGELFFIKGIDYQPGGSSDVTTEKDPLSDPVICARDVALFQDLGVNTIRIYSINPDLKHDECMNMLATAGIYLLLDVNSPLEGQHLHRYEPWTTYTKAYVEHIFKVVEQFSAYPNTLGFFAGNEVINDKKSARNSPIYVKRLIGDIKDYIATHSNRTIPVGYSAADDLDFRVSLSSFLECSHDDMPNCEVDFYGVNSYQWCGEQTFKSSGYDKLVESYRTYTKPVFFSEFGCNKVLPRKFNEIATLFSKDMTDVFSGGLVYEFTQESNNYGLIRLENDDEVTLLDDFYQLRSQYRAIDLNSLKKEVQKEKKKGRKSKKGKVTKENNVANSLTCKDNYENINVNMKIPKSMAESFIDDGVKVERGKIIELDDMQLVSNKTIYNSDGTLWSGKREIMRVYGTNPIPNNIGAKQNEQITKDQKRKNSSTRYLVSGYWYLILWYMFLLF